MSGNEPDAMLYKIKMAADFVSSALGLTLTGLEGHICPSLVMGLEGHICPSVVTSWWRHCDVI